MLTTLIGSLLAPWFAVLMNSPYIVIPIEIKESQWEYHVFIDEGVKGVALPAGYQRNKHVEGLESFYLNESSSFALELYGSHETLTDSNSSTLWGKPLQIRQNDAVMTQPVGGEVQFECKTDRLELVLIVTDGKLIDFPAEQACKSLFQLTGK